MVLAEKLQTNNDIQHFDCLYFSGKRENGERSTCSDDFGAYDVIHIRQETFCG